MGMWYKVTTSIKMKKDPLLSILDLYYNKFPEAISYNEVYEHLHKNRYITDKELDYFKSNKIKRHNQDWQNEEQELNLKKRLFDRIFEDAGEHLHAEHKRMK